MGSEMCIRDRVHCGNGQIDGDEECDDGNVDSGDGCDASCQYECSDLTINNDPFLNSSANWSDGGATPENNVATVYGGTTTGNRIFEIDNHLDGVGGAVRNARQDLTGLTIGDTYIVRAVGARRPNCAGTEFDPNDPVDADVLLDGTLLTTWERGGTVWQLSLIHI